MTHKGKIKSIAVTQVSERMQVISFDPQYEKEVIVTYQRDEEYGLCYCLADKQYPKSRRLWPRSAVNFKDKTLVVEYKDERDCLALPVLPLKYSQWQSAIENGLVDSDKEVEFEIKTITPIQGKYAGLIEIAEIIPQKKRMYSEGDMRAYLLTLDDDEEIEIYQTDRATETQVIEGFLEFMKDK